MSTTTTLNFVLVVEGAVTQLEITPQLESPTESYGVINLETGDVIVASGTGLDELGNAYTYDIVDAAADQTYRYYIKVEYNASTYYLARTTALTTSAAFVVGRYTNSWRIEQQFGIDNVHKWLGIDDSDEAVDYAVRAYGFIAGAEAEIDDMLRGGPCDIPFSTDVPEIIALIATALAGVRMYEARGVMDVNQGTGQVQHRLQYQSKWVEKQIGRIKSGQVKLAADNVRRYPGVF